MGDTNGYMMKLEDQIVSLELAKEMKELGMKQESVWFWTWTKWNEKIEWVLIHHTMYNEQFSAYTVAELGEMLPCACFSMKLEGSKNPPWFCDAGLLYPRAYSSNEADARAKMLIYLIKAGIIEK